MKVKVHFDLCEVSGMCESIAPDVFEIDDDDFLQVKKEEIGPEDEETVRRAVASCPHLALALDES